MRYTGPKNRISRREGIDLGLKTPGSKAQASLLKKINILPGQHGTKGRRKVSDHGKQLREKQKLRFFFGLTESQMKNYFKKAVRKTGNTGLFLCQYLEKRLDNIVYRLGMAPTRASARQLVTHRHIRVNGKSVSSPSYVVRIGEKIEFAKAKTYKIPAIEKAVANKDIILPKWLLKQGNVGQLTEETNSELIENQFNLRLVIEFYSR